MADVLNFYIDDSGTRHPTRDPGRKPEHGYDYFALGGILVREQDERAARVLHRSFCRKWGITYPLHSSEIRSRNGNFLWLRGLSEDDWKAFYEDLYLLMRDAPVIGLACVIDRAGYNNRYLEIYKQKPWSLCKTAFSVVVERAAKFARKSELRLRVAPERCNKPEDRLLESYYDSLKNDGTPFAQVSSGKYQPLQSDEFMATLYEFKLKDKSSPMSQLADLFLWPICIGGYHASNRPYDRLMSDGKLIECHVDEADWAALASKYSCFDDVERKA